ncbi:hypothetical protein P9112_009150 [Eukaryota sp. TZLM1-RC]
MLSRKRRVVLDSDEEDYTPTQKLHVTSVYSSSEEEPSTSSSSEDETTSSILFYRQIDMGSPKQEATPSEPFENSFAIFLRFIAYVVSHNGVLQEFKDDSLQYIKVHVKRVQEQCTTLARIAGSNTWNKKYTKMLRTRPYMQLVYTDTGPLNENCVACNRPLVSKEQFQLRLDGPEISPNASWFDSFDNSLDETFEPPTQHYLGENCAYRTYNFHRLYHFIHMIYEQIAEFNLTLHEIDHIDLDSVVFASMFRRYKKIKKLPEPKSDQQHPLLRIGVSSFSSIPNIVQVSSEYGEEDSD